MSAARVEITYFNNLYLHVPHVGHGKKKGNDALRNKKLLKHVRTRHVRIQFLGEKFLTSGNLKYIISSKREKKKSKYFSKGEI